MDDITFDYKYGFSKPENYQYKAKKGLSRQVVLAMSALKKEPAWMTEFRLKSLQIFQKKKDAELGGRSHKN